MKPLIALTFVLLAASCSTGHPMYVPVLKVIPLQHGSADHVARTLNDEEGRSPSRSVEHIDADTRTNSIVLKGSPKDLDRIEKRIRELDR